MVPVDNVTLVGPEDGKTRGRRAKRYPALVDGRITKIVEVRLSRKPIRQNVTLDPVGQAAGDKPRPRVVGRRGGGLTRAPRGSTRIVDAMDRTLIEQLQKDGRRSFVDLAKSVGLSEAAVRHRVQHLLDAGVMQIVAITDPLSLGFHRMALIGVKTRGDMMAVADAIGAIKEVTYVVLSTGAFDLLVEVVCGDDAELLTLLNDKIRNVTGVTDTETFIYLRLHKQTYEWGTR